MIFLREKTRFGTIILVIDSAKKTRCLNSNNFLASAQAKFKIILSSFARRLDHSKKPISFVFLSKLCSFIHASKGLTMADLIFEQFVLPYTSGLFLFI